MVVNRTSIAKLMQILHRPKTKARAPEQEATEAWLDNVPCLLAPARYSLDGGITWRLGDLPEAIEAIEKARKEGRPQ